MKGDGLDAKMLRVLHLTLLSQLPLVVKKGNGVDVSNQIVSCSVGQ